MGYDRHGKFQEGERSKTKVPSVEGGGGDFLELNNGNFSFLVFLRLSGFTMGSSEKNRFALVPGYMLGVFYGRIVIKEMLNAVL